jgi:hypothetical protein
MCSVIIEQVYPVTIENSFPYPAQINNKKQTAKNKLQAI